MDAPTARPTGREATGVSQALEDSSGPWTFEIVRPTPAAFRSRKGDRALGSRSQQEIAVSHTEKGVIGFAPPRESAEMLSALRRSPGNSLSGEVVAAGGEQERKSPWVTLDIVDGG